MALRLPTLPKSPGIYLFYNSKGALIYVGKATSLRQRVQSYFRGPRSRRPIEDMIGEVTKIDFRVTDSVLEAILLEARYIKKYQPLYNIKGRDDKSWVYLAVTKDCFPRLVSIREHDLSASTKLYAKIFGPFPGLKTVDTLRLLRRLFKFSTCSPGQKRPCLYRQMRECLGVCTNEITPVEYRRQVVRPMVAFLSGRKKQLLRELKTAMATASRQQSFETAQRLRDQIFTLQKFQDIALINNDFLENPAEIKTGRIEGYDISNISGTSAVGSMVVFKGDEAEKSQYRKFKIRAVLQADDTAMLQEVLRRRLQNDWPLPDLILIDGGLPQVNASRAVLVENSLSIPLVGIAKGPERKKNELIGHLPAGISLDTLIKVRDEAHRFAISYHRQLRGKKMFE